MILFNVPKVYQFHTVPITMLHLFETVTIAMHQSTNPSIGGLNRTIVDLTARGVEADEVSLREDVRYLPFDTDL